MSAPHLHDSARHYATVAKAIEFIRERSRQQPGLEEIAAAVHLSPYHLQRLFAEWAGISPKRFLQYLTKNYARERLAACADTLSVAIDAGLSGTGRLHDLMVSCEAMTPGEIKTGGLGTEIGFGFAASPFGEAMVAWSPRGVCHFAFRTQTDDGMLAELVRAWPKARLGRDDDQAMALMARIFSAAPTRGKIHLVLRGTNFQIKVWEALIATDFGQIVSYRQLASLAGVPDAQRAVGSAVGANNIGFLIPCHRAIRASGEVGDYRWGSERKLALLGWEAARQEEATSAAQ